MSYEILDNKLLNNKVNICFNCKSNNIHYKKTQIFCNKHNLPFKYDYTHCRCFKCKNVFENNFREYLLDGQENICSECDKENKCAVLYKQSLLESAKSIYTYGKYFRINNSENIRERLLLLMNKVKNPEYKKLYELDNMSESDNKDIIDFLERIDLDLKKADLNDIITIKLFNGKFLYRNDYTLINIYDYDYNNNDNIYLDLLSNNKLSTIYLDRREKGKYKIIDDVYSIIRFYLIYDLSMPKELLQIYTSAKYNWEFNKKINKSDINSNESDIIINDVLNIVNYGYRYNYRGSTEELRIPEDVSTSIVLNQFGINPYLKEKLIFTNLDSKQFLNKLQKDDIYNRQNEQHLSYKRV